MLRCSKTYLITNPVEVYKGLAFEQSLYFLAMKDAIETPVLCVWRSTPSVVIGRNQNVFVEANIPFLKRHGIDLARRDSGGGTVFHDDRNLNICVIKKANTDIEENLGLVCEILQSLGICTTIDMKHNILYGGKKISGSAFRYSSNTHLHHFTLLLNTNLEWLKESLTARHGLEIETLGIPSNRMEVTNLGIEIDRILQAFESAGNLGAVQHVTQLDECAPEIFINEWRRLESNIWIYNRNPHFKINLELDRSRYSIEVAKGYIVKIVEEDSREQLALDTQSFYEFISLQSEISCSIIEGVRNALYTRLLGGIA